MSRLERCAVCGCWRDARMPHSSITCLGIRELRLELAAEKARARRVVRVFWRVRDESIDLDETRLGRADALEVKARWGGKLYRVTVRRRSPVVRA